jgi:hypothetical protein
VCPVLAQAIIRNDLATMQAAQDAAASAGVVVQTTSEEGEGRDPKPDSEEVESEAAKADDGDISSLNSSEVARLMQERPASGTWADEVEEEAMEQSMVSVTEDPEAQGAAGKPVNIPDGRSSEAQ